MALVSNPDAIRLAMLGMVPGNGHPYSWSAIINGGYDERIMADCGYPAIVDYLRAAPPGALGIPGVSVTHVWCDDVDEARRVAGAAHIPNVVASPEEVLGQVDAVIVATDIGYEHLERARAFIEARVPTFIDKPLTDREDHLQQFIRWHGEDRPFMSTSCMRYAREYALLRERLAEVGTLRLITLTMSKSWERYGIHAVEAVYPFLAPGGWVRVTNTGTAEANIVHLRHRRGVDVVLGVIADLGGAFGHLTVSGTAGTLTADFLDTLHAFKTQLQMFVDFLRTGAAPVDFAETIEEMRIIIAGIRSREQGSRPVLLEEICP